MKKYTKKNLNSSEFQLLEELSAGDVLIGFLLSARSTSGMFNVARARAQKRYRDKLVLNRMQGNGLIKINGDKINLTKFGNKLLEQRKIADSLKNKRQKWDKKWRMISFDIPQDSSDVRNKLRSLLRTAGFLKIQQSVYIYPHACDQLIDFINKDPKIKKYITFAVITYSNNQKKWERDFSKLIE